MGSRTDHFKKIGYNPGIGPRVSAFQHEENRQRVVASILLELHIMAISEIIKREDYIKTEKHEESFAAAGAVSQNFQGSKKENTNAAHCVPRQLKINNKTPQELMQEVFPERTYALNLLFGEVDVLPVVYNLCDSRAENKGLGDSFRKACEFIVRAGHTSGQMRAETIIVKAKSAYDIYKVGATVAFRESVQELKNNLKTINFLSDKKRQSLTEQLQITESYSEALRESAGASKGLAIWKIEGLINIYKEFK